MPHLIILDEIDAILLSLNGAQPDTDIWNALRTAVVAAHAALESSIPNSQKNRIRHKLEDVEALLEAGEPYNMLTVESLTNELNMML